MIQDISKVERKEIIQSYIVTTARYDFSVYEKRIVYRIVEMMQGLLSGQKLNKDLRSTIVKNQNVFGTNDMYEVTMPVASVLCGDEDNNHDRVKKALKGLHRKYIEFEDNGLWREITLISNPTIRKYESYMTFKMHDDIYDAFMNFSKGYKKYELKTAMKFKSVFAMRFYELFSKQRTPLIYSIRDLKIMFGVEKHYKNNAGFIQKVIKVAQKELNEKSPYSFEYTPLKTGREFTSIKFYPVIIRENYDEAYEKMDSAEWKRQTNLTYTLETHIINYLKEHYKFSKPEIQNNRELFEKAQKQIPDLLLFLSELKAKAADKGNPKGYLINALKIKMKMKKPKSSEITEDGGLFDGGAPEGVAPVTQQTAAILKSVLKEDKPRRAGKRTAQSIKQIVKI